jgi:alcohol dehydrogenase (cytochrome c)
MKTPMLPAFLVLGLASGALAADVPRGLDPALLTKPPTDSWPTYHGDYSGRRYSTLSQINADNVKGLSLA